jgi:hypothetical protein
MSALKINAGSSARAKAERAEDAARAMAEYKAEKRAVLVKTARLRELRLAKEAQARAERQSAPLEPQTAKKHAAKR